MCTQDSSISENQHDTIIHVIRSDRSRMPPTKLKDYHCNIIKTKSGVHFPFPYHISKACSYETLSCSFQNFMLSVSYHYEPQYYHQACKYPNWRQAMTNEPSAMEDNNTWSTVTLPPDNY